MEKYFDLHDVKHTQKVHIETLYLETKFVWYQLICSCKPLVAWLIFTDEMIEHYEDTKINTFFYPIDKSQIKGLNGKAH